MEIPRRWSYVELPGRRDWQHRKLLRIIRNSPWWLREKTLTEIAEALEVESIYNIKWIIAELRKYGVKPKLQERDYSKPREQRHLRR